MNEPTVEHHGWCKHSANSWNLALSAALACAGKNMPADQRAEAVQIILSGETLRYRGVRFTKAT